MSTIDPRRLAMLQRMGIDVWRARGDDPAFIEQLFDMGAQGGKITLFFHGESYPVRSYRRLTA